MEGVVGEVGERDWLLFGRFEGFSWQEGPFIEVVDDEEALLGLEELGGEMHGDFSLMLDPRESGEGGGGGGVRGDGSEIGAFKFQDVLGGRELDGVDVGGVSREVDDDGFGRGVFGGAFFDVDRLVKGEGWWTEVFSGGGVETELHTAVVGQLEEGA